MAIPICASSSPQAKLNFHAENCPLLSLSPISVAVGLKPTGDRTKKSNWLDQNSPQALRLVPTIARIKTYDKDDLYLFPPSKMLPVSWDRTEQTELLSSLRRIPGPFPAGPCQGRQPALTSRGSTAKEGCPNPGARVTSPLGVLVPITTSLNHGLVFLQAGVVCYGSIHRPDQGK